MEFTFVYVRVKSLSDVQKNTHDDVLRPRRLMLDENDQFVPYAKAEVVILFVGEHVVKRNNLNVGDRRRRILWMQRLKKLKRILWRAKQIRKNARFDLAI